MKDAEKKSVSEEMLKLNSLAQDIALLGDTATVGLDSKINGLTSDDFKQTEKIMYEIAVAGTFVKLGHVMKFVEPKSVKHKRNYDILWYQVRLSIHIQIQS